MANKAHKRKHEAIEDSDIKRTKKFKTKNSEWFNAGGEDGDMGTSGMILLKFQPGKRYAHTATTNYQLTMACLQPEDKKHPNCACSQMIKGNKKFVEHDDRVMIIVEHDLKEHILCILDKKKVHQCKLDLMIQSGEQIAFKAVGKIPVQLIGKTRKAC